MIQSKSKKVFHLIPLILIALSFISSPIKAFSEGTFAWEVSKYGYVEDFGVDKENNYMFFYREDDNYSTTWISKYSEDGELVFNDSIDMGWQYFLSKEEIIDKNNNTYFISKSDEEIIILKYDLNWNFVSKTNISVEITGRSSFGTTKLFITDLGTIYLLTTESIEFLDWTYIKHTDKLYKINSDDKADWDLTFENTRKKSTGYTADIAEYYDGVLFFSYTNQLYRIDSHKGKIKWEDEMDGTIRGLVAFGEEVCITYSEDGIGEPFNVEYFDKEKSKLWEETFRPQIGFLSLRKIEQKLDKIAIHVWDNIDGGVTEETIETYRIINTRGKYLVKHSWTSWPYFCNWRHFYLAYTNSYYVHHDNLPNHTSYITKYTYDAPSHIEPPKQSAGFGIMLGVIGCIVITIIRRKNIN